MLSNCISIARGTWGVADARGVSVTRGVTVMDGVVVMVGDKEAVGDKVLVGVKVGVMVGGKNRYTSGSICDVINPARIPNITAHTSIRQPRIIRSRRMRKNGSLLAPRIDMMPPNTSKTIATRARMTTV